MLESAIQNQLKEYLKMLRQPIELIGSLDQSDTGREMAEMLGEINSLSDSVSLRLDGVAKLKPSFAIARQGEAGRVEFAGIPMGHEFTSLVLGLLHVGGHPPKIEASVVEQIKAINKPLKFETFISLSCHNCPDVVQALNTMAALNPNIQHVMIDGSVNQDLVNERKVMAVPTVFLNGEPFASGRMTVEEILNKVDDSAVQKQADKVNQKSVFDMLIVGGGPAGASAAIYAARKGLNTGIVAERFGGQVMDTLGIENFISVKATEGPKLVTALEQHVSEYDVDVMNLQRAKALSKEGDLFRVDLESGASVRSKSVVISTGARWRELNVPGEQQYKGKGVAYCPHCDGPLFKGKPVAVIGGGNSGIEAAIDLAGVVSEVTVLEFADSLRADQVLINKANSMPNIRIIKSAQTTEVLGNGEKVTGLRYTDRSTGQSNDLTLDGIFVQIGLLPNTDWVKGSLELSRHGEIVVDAKGQTSLPGVFAAGDCTTVPYKQIIIAMGEGANASLGAFDYLIRQTPQAA